MLMSHITGRMAKQLLADLPAASEERQLLRWRLEQMDPGDGDDAVYHVGDVPEVLLEGYPDFQEIALGYDWDRIATTDDRARLTSAGIDRLLKSVPASPIPLPTA